MSVRKEDEVLQVLNSNVTKYRPDDGIFEVALVLGGTVSSGAYTAGFLDKLIEALDAWYVAKANAEDVPSHNVKLRVAAGASGGGVCAAILARALAFGFPHISPSSPEAEWNRNPFYKTWVQDLDIAGFVETSDIDGGKPVKSLLNGKVLGEAAKTAARFQGDRLPAGWSVRPYVDNPFRVIVTLANLTGVPYEIDFGNLGRQSYRVHADYARFACDIGGSGSVVPSLRPDEFFVQDGGPEPAVNWLTLAKYARASGAFPLGFPAVELSRPRKHYDYRVAVVPDDNGQVKVVPLLPNWAGSTNVSDEYAFLSVDGGTFNNEPIELARTFLAGATGRNPRDPDKAHRGVMLIDPLPGTAQLGPRRIESLVKLGGAVLSSLVSQGRYATTDLLLMADPNVFSRYLALPKRGTISGEKALATAGLCAFLGFFEEKYRRHDYMLGRANCHTYLAERFVLAETNPIFKGRWSHGQKQVFGQQAGKGFLPLIPLVSQDGKQQQKPDGTMPWPSGKLEPRQIRNRLEGRLEKIVKKVADEATDVWFSDLLIWALKGVVTSELLDPIEELARADLRDWQLYNETRSD